jgi:hypothetical protein
MTSLIQPPFPLNGITHSTQVPGVAADLVVVRLPRVCRAASTTTDRFVVPVVGSGGADDAASVLQHGNASTHNASDPSTGIPTGGGDGGVGAGGNGAVHASGAPFDALVPTYSDTVSTTNNTGSTLARDTNSTANSTANASTNSDMGVRISKHPPVAYPFYPSDVLLVNMSNAKYPLEDTFDALLLQSTPHCAARCAVFDRISHSRVPLSFTPLLRLKRACV